MDCSETRENIWMYVSGELPEDTARSIESHIAACPECAEKARKARDFVLTLGYDIIDDSVENKKATNELISQTISAFRRKPMAIMRKDALPKPRGRLPWPPQTTS